MASLRQNFQGGKNALPKSTPGTTTPVGFNKVARPGPANPEGRSGSASTARLEHEMTKINDSKDPAKNPFKEVARRAEEAGSRKHDRPDDSGEEDKAPAPKRARRGPSSQGDKENVPDTAEATSDEDSDDDYVQVVKTPDAKCKGRVGKSKKAEATKEKPKKDAEVEDTQKPKKVTATKPKKTQKADAPPMEDVIEDSAEAGTSTAKPAATTKPKPRKVAANKQDGMETDPAVDNPEFFKQLRKAMKFKGPFPAGSLAYIELYISGYGRWTAAQTLLQDERRLAHQLDVYEAEGHHRIAMLALQEREHQLRAQELGLRERELKMQEQERALHAKELALAERGRVLRGDE
ncbi:hypothetical protein C8R45DRAFT_964788 [Mycena sanguinolenta]|nr:hypothetical protein C8R45DRAFT_964788 [Mycena sanguinolenta]